REQLLSEVLNQLQDFYVFDLKDPDAKLNGSCTFSGNFEKQTLNDILQELALVVGLEYKLENDVLTIQNLACP
ncbi:MAG: FecR domain-containing protein, partial [Owenweeksia sp.]